MSCMHLCRTPTSQKIHIELCQRSWGIWYPARTSATPGCPVTLAPATSTHGSNAGMELSLPAQDYTPCGAGLAASLQCADISMTHTRQAGDRRCRNRQNQVKHRVICREPKSRCNVIECTCSQHESLPLFAAAGSVVCNLTVFHANAMCSASAPVSRGRSELSCVEANISKSSYQSSTAKSPQRTSAPISTHTVLYRGLESLGQAAQCQVTDYSN